MHKEFGKFLVFPLIPSLLPSLTGATSKYNFHQEISVNWCQGRGAGINLRTGLPWLPFEFIVELSCPRPASIEGTYMYPLLIPMNELIIISHLSIIMDC